MSKAFIAATIQDSACGTGVAISQAAADLTEAIIKSVKTKDGLKLPSFGTFTVRKTKACTAMTSKAG